MYYDFKSTSQYKLFASNLEKKVEAYDSVVSQLFYVLICNILFPMPIVCSRQVFLHLTSILETQKLSSNYRK